MNESDKYSVATETMHRSEYMVVKPQHIYGSYTQRKQIKAILVHTIKMQQKKY